MKASTHTTQAHGHLWGRRDWLTRLAWGSVGATLGLSLASFVRFLFRRAPIRPPSVFRAGDPAALPPNSVSSRFVRQWRVFLVRRDDRVFAIHARCTHLGCTPRWRASAHKFKCPCHGSGFTIDGINIEGPAPRPLERARVWLGRDGALWVDAAVRLRPPAWKKPGAFVSLGRPSQRADDGEVG